MLPSPDLVGCAIWKRCMPLTSALTLPPFQTTLDHRPPLPFGVPLPLFRSRLDFLAVVVVVNLVLHFLLRHRIRLLLVVLVVLVVVVAAFSSSYHLALLSSMDSPRLDLTLRPLPLLPTRCGRRRLGAPAPVLVASAVAQLLPLLWARPTDQVEPLSMAVLGVET